jgi:hypothetical protein
LLSVAISSNKTTFLNKLACLTTAILDGVTYTGSRKESVSSLCIFREGLEIILGSNRDGFDGDTNDG